MMWSVLESDMILVSNLVVKQGCLLSPQSLMLFFKLSEPHCIQWNFTQQLKTETTLIRFNTNTTCKLFIKRELIDEVEKLYYLGSFFPTKVKLKPMFLAEFTELAIIQYA